MMAFLGEVQTFVKDHGEDPAMAPFVKPLQAGLNDLQGAVMWLMQNAFAKPDNAGAGATDFMHLFGLVALGYMWGRIAKAALIKQAEAPSPAGTRSSRAAGSSWSGCCPRRACGWRESRPERRAPWRWRRRRSEGTVSRTPAASFRFQGRGQCTLCSQAHEPATLGFIFVVDRPNAIQRSSSA